MPRRRQRTWYGGGRKRCAHAALHALTNRRIWAARRAVDATEQRFVLPSVGAKGTGSGYIARDGDAAPGVNPTFAALPVDPKTIATLKLIPRSMLQYTGGAAEEVIRADMAAEHTEVMQTKFLFGDATASPLEPDGLVKHCTISGIAAAQLMDRDALLAFLGVVENTALSPDLLRWFFPPKLRRTFESTFWVQPLADRKTDERLLMPDADDLLDYPFVQRRYLRDGLGVGLHERDLIFGDFRPPFFTRSGKYWLRNIGMRMQPCEAG